MGRFATAWQAFWAILRSETTAETWRRCGTTDTLADAEQPAPDTPETAPAEKTHADAVYTLALLQREGRLIDFLQEDISAYQDAQIGAAVRQIHENCRKVLERHFGIQPVEPAAEGSSISIPTTFDPRRIRVIGNAPGEPPFTGTLRHKGWQASRIDLPERHNVLDPAVICPAEVEV